MISSGPAHAWLDKPLISDFPSTDFYLISKLISARAYGDFRSCRTPRVALSSRTSIVITGLLAPLVCSCAGYDGRSCFQCYSGPLCKTREDSLTCQLASTGGNPLVIAQYWLQNSTQEPCSTTLAHYRLLFHCLSPCCCRLCVVFLLQTCLPEPTRCTISPTGRCNQKTSCCCKCYSLCASVSTLYNGWHCPSP